MALYPRFTKTERRKRHQTKRNVKEIHCKWLPCKDHCSITLCNPYCRCRFTLLPHPLSISLRYSLDLMDVQQEPRPMSWVLAVRPFAVERCLFYAPSRQACSLGRVRLRRSTRFAVCIVVPRLVCTRRCEYLCLACCFWCLYRRSVWMGCGTRYCHIV